MRVDILSLFPAVFEGFLNHGVPRIAREKGLLHASVTDFRQFAEDRRGTVDDRPFGGGPGMVLMCGPIFRAVEHIEASPPVAGLTPRRIMLTPQGRVFNQELAQELAREPWLLLLCGHYEGFDERIRLGLQPLEISVGDYVLSGGELAAMIIVDAVTRLQAGALGHAESAHEDSFSNEYKGLEWPQFTRPRVFREMTVPDILLSGDHGAIARWRRDQGTQRTRERRPDLLPSGE